MDSQKNQNQPSNSPFEHHVVDPAIRQSFIARYFSRTRLLVLIVALLTGAGSYTYATLTKELNPDIKIPTVFVSTILPGASPEDLETLVTIPIEDAVKNLEDVEKVTSTSQESLSTTSIEFHSSADPNRAKDDVQSAIDGLSNLPEDAKTPIVQVLDFQNQPSYLFLLSNQNDHASLERFADQLEETLKDIPGVEKVSLNHRNEQVIRVTLLPETISTYGISETALVQTISRALDASPAGAVSSESHRFNLSLAAPITSIDTLKETLVPIGSSFVPLESLATIQEAPPHDRTEAFFASKDQSPERGIVFSVFQSENADTGETISRVNQAFTKQNEISGKAFQLTPIFDGAKEIQKSFDQLFHDFRLTIGLVFVVLLLFFGLRQSVVAALAIPLTFLGTFLVMFAVDISVNFISLFSLLLALGILVDNAIVVVSAVSQYERRDKLSPRDAVILVFRDFHTVILTTTITTVWAFLPLLLATGIIGEFIKPIPIVVSTALALSAIIALFIVLPLMALLMERTLPKRVRMFLRGVIWVVLIAFLFALFRESLLFPWAFILSVALLPLLALVLPRVRSTLSEHFIPKKISLFFSSKENGWFSLDRLSERYYVFIKSILESASARKRTIVFLVTFMIFSYALVPTGFVVNEFFPEDDTDFVYVSLTLPSGISFEQSRSATLTLLDTLRTFKEADSVVAEIGAKPPTDNTPSGTEPNRVLYTLLLPNKKDRVATSGDIVEELNREFSDWSNGVVSASQLSGGPPAGSDLTLKISGDDLPTLKEYAETTKAFLKTTPGTSNITSSLDTFVSKIIFVPDREKLAAFGVTPDSIALSLRNLGSSFPIKTDIRLENKEWDIELTSNDHFSFDTPETLTLLTIPTKRGDIPLTALGRFTLESDPIHINREDGKRTVTISAGVDQGYSVSETNKILETFADQSLGLTSGYEWKTGGVNEENNKSVQSILLAMLLSAALIFGTMSIQFDSFRKALIVLLVIPLAVSGVFIIFALSAIPLSFPALIGILALFGIVVNNSIIMVDKINKNMDRGLPLDEAIAEGAASRLEPILLTALTTIVGLIPITLSDPIWQGLGGAIIAGLTFSGIAKLFFIPVIYKSWFRE